MIAPQVFFLHAYLIFRKKSQITDDIYIFLLKAFLEHVLKFDCFPQCFCLRWKRTFHLMHVPILFSSSLLFSFISMMLFCYFSDRQNSMKYVEYHSPIHSHLIIYKSIIESINQLINQSLSIYFPFFIF